MKSVLKWFYVKLWQEPKDIKGVGWLLTFYAYVLLGFAVGSIVCQTPGGFFLLIAFSLSSMLLQHMNKPKKLGRPLPYRRRREHRFR